MSSSSDATDGDLPAAAPLPSGAAAAAAIPRIMGLADLVLFYVSTGFGPQWIAVAVAIGTQSLALWPVAFTLFYLPLAFSILELSSRYPGEGGLYVWSREAFGEFAGFLAGWCYWFCNLPYFANGLYFSAGSILFLDSAWRTRLAGRPEYFVTFSLLALLLVTGVNILGLRVGKWLHNAGAICKWSIGLAVVIFGVVAWMRFGSSPAIEHVKLLFSFKLTNLALLGSMAYAFSGPEAASFMGDEIKNPRHTIPRALLISGSIVGCLYFLATLATLAALPVHKFGGLTGSIGAIFATSQRLGSGWVIPAAAVAVVLGQLGAIGSFLAACARILFVSGLDRRLPSAFTRIHPRWGSPYLALIAQAVMTALVIVLGQTGTSVWGAYSILLSMSIVTAFIPYLFMFAALIRLQSRPVGPNVMRVPGGRGVAILVGATGFLTTLATIGLAFAGSDEGTSDGTSAAVKLIVSTLGMLAMGVIIFGYSSCARYRRG